MKTIRESIKNDQTLQRQWRQLVNYVKETFEVHERRKEDMVRSIHARILCRYVDETKFNAEDADEVARQLLNMIESSPMFDETFDDFINCIGRLDNLAKND